MVRVAADAFAIALGIEVKVFAPAPPPVHAFDRHRIQYDAALIIKRIESTDFVSCLRVVALVDVDLFVPVFTFVFGEARKGGRVAVASVFRLKDQPERLAKISLHEFGHLCMLDHCHGDDGCVMNFTSDIDALDRIPARFCRYCLGQVKFMARSPIPQFEP
jgi:archaemetzincin